MTEPTKGGTYNKVLTGRTAASLQRYRDSKEEGVEPYLFAVTRNCSVDVQTQIAEWKAVREEHGTQGEVRRRKAKYESVDAETGLHDSGQRGTHVREFYAGRWRKRPVRDGETPTHLRIEPEELTVKGSEAVHTIYAAGGDLVNPQDPESAERFMQAVLAEREANYAGLQESIWAERNGTSGLLHVHVATNATVYQDFEAHGVKYKAGSKMAGDLTRVHAVRKNFNEFLREHPELGFEQAMADVGTQKYIDAQNKSAQKSYWDRKRGKESNHDRIRREVGVALASDQVTGGDHESYAAALKNRGIEIKEVGLRRGKPGKNHDYSYRVEGSTAWTRGKTLGATYSHSGIDEQLARKARGEELELGDDRQHAGPPQELPLAGELEGFGQQEELRALQRNVSSQAYEEHKRQWDEQERQRKAEFKQMLNNVPDPLDEMRAAEAAGRAPSATPRPEVREELEELTPTTRKASSKEKESEEKLEESESRREPTKKKEFVPRTWTVPSQSRIEEEDEEDEEELSIATPMDEPEVEPVSIEQPAVAVAEESESVEERDEETPEAEIEEEEPFSSRLHGVTSKSSKVQARIDTIAELEDQWHEQLPQTPEDRAQFEQRVLAAKGIDRQFLSTYGDRMDPTMHEALERRAAWRAQTNEVFQEEKALYYALQDHDAGKTRLPDRDETNQQRRMKERKKDRLAEEVKAGDYLRSPQELQREKDERLAKARADLHGRTADLKTSDRAEADRANDLFRTSGRGPSRGIEL